MAMMDLPQFDETATCEKCGNGEIIVIFHADTTRGHAR